MISQCDLILHLLRKFQIKMSLPEPPDPVELPDFQFRILRTVGGIS